MSPTKGARLSNFELLRVVAMVLIVSHHYGVHSKWGEFDREVPALDPTVLPGPDPALGPVKTVKMMFNVIFVYILQSGGKVGVNLFLLLSGYFLNFKRIKGISIARTWTQTLTWTILIFTVMSFRRPMYSGDYYLSFMPILTLHYWFISVYIAVMLLSTAIAVTSKYTTSAQLVAILAVQAVTMCLLPWDMYNSYSSLAWFYFVVQLGSAIRRFEAPLKRRISTRALVVFILTMNSIVWTSIYYFCTRDVPWARANGGPIVLMYDSYYPMVLIMSVSVFLLGIRLEFSSSIVNWLGSLTFGVYLFHDNFFIRPQLWLVWVDAPRYETLPLFPLVAILQISAVYLGASILEFLRRRIFHDLEQWLVSREMAVCTWVADAFIYIFVPDDCEMIDEMEAKV